MTRLAMIALGALLAASSHALAHEQKAHGKPATHGTIASMDREQLTLTTDSGSVSVTLTDATKIERAGKEVGRGALVPGMPVAVFGTKVPQQGVVAREIVVDEGGTESRRHDDPPGGH